MQTSSKCLQRLRSKLVAVTAVKPVLHLVLSGSLLVLSHATALKSALQLLRTPSRAMLQIMLASTHQGSVHCQRCIRNVAVQSQPDSQREVAFSAFGHQL